MLATGRLSTPYILLLLALTAPPIAALGAEEASPTAGPRRPVQVQVAPVTPGAPVIDGKLDDACWANATRLEGFFVPSLKQAVPEETIGLICADEKAIYVGVICKDRTPEDIKGVETRRNGAIGRDDYVGIELDPVHGHQTAYTYRVTARGTMSESLPGDSASKIEWRGDWQGAAARTPEGWTAEMAIPFAVLRYPRGQSTFGLTLFRYFSREQISVLYPDMGLLYDPSLTADLVGLHTPHVAPRPIYMPFVVADLGESATHPFDAGLDVQYKLENGLTALGTFNPDYTQIEGVVEPVSFSYTERELSEVRPFFVTGASGFFPMSELFYSRRVHDFDAGFKLFGEVGKEKLGLLDAIGFGDENAFVGMWQHNFTTDLNAVIETVQHTKVGEPSNAVYQVELGNTWRHPEGSDMLWGTIVRSAGQDADGAIYTLYTVHDRGAGKLHYEGGLGYITPDYHSDLGYCYDQDTFQANVSLGVDHRYEKGGLRSRSWGATLEYSPYVEQEGIYHSRTAVWSGLGWRNGRSASVGFEYGQDLNQDTTDVWVSTGWNERDLYRSGGLYLLRGTRAGGDYTEVSLSQAVRPWPKVSVRAALQYARLEQPSPDAYHAYQAVITASRDLTTEKSIAARMIARDAGVSFYGAYRQVVRRGMDAYVIVGDPDPDKTGFVTRLAVKLVWAF